ncbi:MAG: XdhC/CoxI family protein [Victivallales bacterium]|nr:XdhC/CoxI family protein [Victivallales bacterium]
MEIYQEILKLKKENKPGVVVTVTEKQGHGPQIPGSKMLVTEEKKTFGTIGGGSLEHAAIQEYDKIIREQKCCAKKYNLDENGKIQDGIKTGMICGGEITLFFECLKTNPSVYIFGAGHVGKAVTEFLRLLNYNISIIDQRQNLNVSFQEELSYSNKDCVEYIEQTEIPEGSFIVITTHSHELDYQVLKKVYASGLKPRYIGLIASKKKSEIIVNRLLEDLNFEPDLNILYSPIGLKIGGKSPAEIGLSIVSELQCINCKEEGNKHASGNWTELLSR